METTTAWTIHHIDRNLIKVAGFTSRNREGGQVVRSEPGHDRDIRLMVEGQAGVGFGLGAVDPDLWYNQGPGLPTLPGPAVYAYGLPGVIDNQGGSAREIRDAREAGRVVYAQVGDFLEVNGSLWRLDWNRFGRQADHHNVKLHPVSGDELGDVQVTGTYSCGCTFIRSGTGLAVRVGGTVWCHEHPRDEDEPDQVRLITLMVVEEDEPEEPSLQEVEAQRAAAMAADLAAMKDLDVPEGPDRDEPSGAAQRGRMILEAYSRDPDQRLYRVLTDLAAWAGESGEADFVYVAALVAGHLR